MKDNDIHQVIEQQDEEKKAMLYSEFEKRHNITTKQPVKRKLTMKVVSCAVAAAAAICLIVSLPFIIQNSKKNSIRYCYTKDCIAEEVSYTIKDYAADNNLNFLYVDWYDIADEVQTKIYVNKDDRTDIIYFNEIIVNAETGEIVHLYIVDKFTVIDMLSFLEEGCGNKSDINGTSVSWNYGNQQGLTVFQYGEYKYYIQLDDPIDQETILNIVEEMISK